MLILTVFIVFRLTSIWITLIHGDTAGLMSEPQLIAVRISSACCDLIDVMIVCEWLMFIHFAVAQRFYSNDAVGLLPLDYVHGVLLAALHNIVTQWKCVNNICIRQCHKNREAHFELLVDAANTRIGQFRRSCVATPAESFHKWQNRSTFFQSCVVQLGYWVGRFEKRSRHLAVGSDHCFHGCFLNSVGNFGWRKSIISLKAREIQFFVFSFIEK